MKRVANEPRRELDSFWEALVSCRGRLPELLRVIAEQVVEVVGEGCVLTMVDGSRTRLQPAVILHRDAEVARAMTAAVGDTEVEIGGPGLAATAAAERRVLMLNDMGPEVIRDVVSDRYVPFAESHPIRSMLVVPMVAGGELVGTLGSIRTSSSEPYSAEDLRLLEALAERAALAIVDTMAAPRKIGAEDYQALFRYSVDGLLITTPDGQILAANPAMCDMVGMTERELMDAGRDAVVVATDPRLGPALAERAAAGRARSLLMLRRGDGSTFEADVTSTIYATGDGRARTCMIIRAVDEQRCD